VGSELRVERLLGEARAKIIWGDSVDEVREWLEDRSVPSQRIDEVVAESLRERGIEFRKKGITELVIGALVVVPSLPILGAMYLIGVLGGMYLIGGVYLLWYAVLLYGLCRCARGIWWLLRGAKSEGSLADE
jgi:hypothetical protein